jgi:hypothetical protein
VDIQIWERTYRFVTQCVLLNPGTNDFTITLERACGLLLSLKDEGMTMAWPDQARYGIQVERLDGEGREQSSGGEENAAYVAVSSPGRYRVTVPDIAGFEPVAPFEVQIKRAEFVEHEIALRRRR